CLVQTTGVSMQAIAGVVATCGAHEFIAADTQQSELPFREIRAIHDEGAVRVYQAYNDAIADAAVAANSFSGPLEQGLWSATRMTWIKPSAVWMAYRCGWTSLKDKNQARVLALDLSRAGFE
ncbi:unnamed protein product, partial [Polarella glacialis]